MQDPSKPIWIKDKKTEVPNVKTLPSIFCSHPSAQ